MTASEAESAARNAARRADRTRESAPEYDPHCHAEVIATGAVGRIVGMYRGPVSGQWLYVIDGDHYYGDQLRPAPASLRVKP